jgi:hypothetical protein
VSANIFISYRREDSSGHAGRLFDGLAARFGEDRIFMDIDSIGPGADFGQVIEQTLESSKVVLVVIGREWTTITDGNGHRRLEDPGDFVRLEVAAALRRSDLVVPILVQGMTMPHASDLPPDLSALTRRNAWELSDGRWSYDLARLCKAIGRTVDQPQEEGTSLSPQTSLDAEELELRQVEDRDVRTPVRTREPSARGSQIAWGASLLLATLVFAAGLLMPFRDPGLRMLDWGPGEALGVVLLAVLLSGAGMLGVVGAPILAGGAFGLGLGALLLRLVVALLTNNFEQGSLTSPGTLVTLLGAGGLMVLGATWAHIQSADQSGLEREPGGLDSGTFGIAISTAAISAAFFGFALRTASMSLPIRGNNIVMAQRDHLWAGLPFFIVTCVLVALVLVWLSPFRYGYIAALGGFAAELTLRLLYPPGRKAAVTPESQQANKVLIISILALLVAAIIKAVEPMLLSRNKTSVVQRSPESRI